MTNTTPTTIDQDSPEGEQYVPPVYPDGVAGALMRQRDLLQHGIDGDRTAAATLTARADQAQEQIDQLDAAIVAMEPTAQASEDVGGQ